MTGYRSLLGTAMAAALLSTGFAAGAQAQDRKPQDLLPPETAPKPTSTPRASVDQAFQEMSAQSGAVVQPIPSLEGDWDVAQASELLSFIEGIGAEGLAQAGCVAADHAIGAALLSERGGQALADGACGAEKCNGWHGAGPVVTTPVSATRRKRKIA